MRNFLRDHWKAIVAIVLLVVLALFTVTPGAAPSVPSLAQRLRAHVMAVGSSEHDTATPQQLEQAARYIESTLKDEGYATHRQVYEAGGQKVRSIQVSIANVAPHTRPERIFIVGAHYDSVPPTLAAGPPGANDNASGTAAVLELARLLKSVHLSRGTEIQFVFFVNEEPPWLSDQIRGDKMGSNQHTRQLHADGMNVAGALILETIGWYSQQRHSQKLPPGLEGRYPDAGCPYAGCPYSGNFIAFVGTLESSRLVQRALAAFQAASDFPAHGLAAPDYVQGVTLSDHASYKRFGYPALMITDTAFGRYPYYKADANRAEDTPDKLDYDSVARVVSGLARTIEALAGEQQG